MSAEGHDTILEVRNLSKMYKLYGEPWDMVLELVTGRPRHQGCWALRDISFSLRRGEVVGVIGSNGAGKSTLLRIIAGILDKTEGEISLRGSVSTILELGTAFHDAYSGRENVRMALLYEGLLAEEAEEKLAEIIAFSELENVIDRPLKTYSSGMRARLSFSTAIAVRDELMLIDEALATGDAYFVQKCLTYLSRLCRDGKTSALLVSHSMPTLTRLCDRALYLSNGSLVMEGHIRDVACEYERATLTVSDAARHAQNLVHPQEPQAPKGSFSITRAFSKANGEVSPLLYVGEAAEIVIEYESDAAIEDVWVGLEIYSQLEGMFVSTLTNKTCRGGDLRKPYEMKVSIAQGRGTVTFKLDPLLYGTGLYFYHFSLFAKESVERKSMEYVEAILHQRYAGHFRVKHRDALATERTQIVEPPLEVHSRGL